LGFAPAVGGRPVTPARVNMSAEIPPNPAWRYFGKEEDATGSGLAMLLIASGMQEPPHVQCLTGRPAVVRVPLQPARDWLAPVVLPTEGVLRGLRLCGFETRCQVVDGPLNERCTMLAGALEVAGGRPILCGPLDRSRLWNRHEGLYSAVPAHFVLILGIDATGLLTLHDPEGMPFAQRPVRHLLNAVQDGGSLISIERSPLAPSRSEILLAALRQTAELREHYSASPDVSARGLRGLVPMLRSAVQVGSARMALHAGLSFRGRCATNLAALAADVGTPRVVGHTLLKLAAESAMALRCLRRDDSVGTSEAIARIADEEDLLDGALAEALGRTSDSPKFPGVRGHE
jgi:hypothetical protein